MRRVIAVLGCTLASFVLAACGPGLTHGTIIAKNYQAGSYSTVWYYVGKVMVPEQRWNSPDWSVELKSGTQTGWVDVDQSTYDKVHVGQYFSG